MLLPAVFLLASTIFVFNCANNAKWPDEIHPNSADYNPNKLLAEFKKMTNSLLDAGGKAAEENVLAKGCQIIQKLHNHPKYKTVIEEHSEFAQLQQSVAKVCNNKWDDNSNSQLIETFANTGTPILAQLRLEEQQLFQNNASGQNVKKELLELGGLVAKLCLSVLPEGHPWKSGLKELLGDKVHLLPSELVQFLTSKTNSMTEQQQQQLGSPKAYHRRMRRADSGRT
uniref:Uncharacterized protein n=1 Tax=Globodera rostochiensis TaxID=31243 RepID=A0A914I0P4_GLORO